MNKQIKAQETDLHCTRIRSQKHAAYSRLSSVKTSDEFRRVYKTGRYISDSGIVLYTRANGLPHSRLGVSVSGKSGNSVFRHRFVRLMREIFRLHQQELEEGLDFIVMVRKTYHLDKQALFSYEEMEQRILNLLKRARVIHSKSK